MRLLADLHVHSRFSRATSPELSLPALHRAALDKGIGLVGTGDFTHPVWRAEIADQLEPAEEGLFRLKPELARAAEEGLPMACANQVRFVLQAEISNIYKVDGRVRKNHNLVYAPSLDAAKRFADRLAAIGTLESDGRPILGLSARDLLEITLETDPLSFLVPAHIWTPWFSMLGSKSGFDSLKECFGDLADHVFAAETGLSSDPPMNWRLRALDRLTMVSNSDAHSPATLGREANQLDIEPGFAPLRRALFARDGFLETVEFYPEEGKYHLDGHRQCGVRLDPEETRSLGGRCPECGGKLTVGVASRVLELADRPHGIRPDGASPFQRLVPLAETVAQVLDIGPTTKGVRRETARLREALGPELSVLREVPVEDIQRVSGAVMAEAIRRIRTGELTIAPGYDGEFGTVRIFSPAEREELFGQLSFLQGAPRPQRPTAAAAAAAPARGDHPTNAADLDAEPLADRARTAARRLSLDDQQLAAVEATGGPLLIMAGPGTGKTLTLVSRIAHQVRVGAVRPERVLAVTFTNQAAEELGRRILREVPGATPEAPTVTTFHGLGRRLLAGLSGREPAIISEGEQLVMIQRAAGGLSERVARAIRDRISLSKQSRDPWEVLSGDQDLLPVIARYQEILEEARALDVDDLVLRPYQHLATDPAAAGRLASRWSAICIDEYQDVNDVQAALVQLLSPEGTNLAVIGDPNQAIYGFRGARPGHFIRFADSYEGTTVVRLENSYRLTDDIVRAAASVLSDEQPLRPLRTGPPVEFVTCPTAESEAEQVLVRLERIVGGTSHFAVDSGRGAEAEHPDVGFGDIAVLARTRSQRDLILKALQRSAIPCRSVGEEEPHDPRSQKVALMTMHAAKGREFEVVFVTGLEEGLMPLHRDDFPTDEDEERRLLYVAMTRSRRLLVLSHSEQRTMWGRRLPGRPSPFVGRLPRTVIRSSPALAGRKPADSQLRLF